MEKNHLVFIISFLCVSFNFAQDPAQTNKSVYNSGDKLYINKDLGIYLWISTSPDQNSEKFRLISDSSSKYSNPLYFDTEGYNTVRTPSAVDTSTRKVIYPLQDIIFEVYSDGIPPISKITIDSKNYKNIGSKSYYGFDTEIKLKASDVVSGVESILFSLNGEVFNQYGKPLSNFIEGENTLRFYSIDKVGNSEEVQTKVFYIDNTPPKTEYEINGLLNQNYVSPDAVIKLKSTDNLSGVSAIFYKIGNGNVMKYVNPIPVANIKDDNSQIGFYAEDNLGNKEKMVVIGGKTGNLQVQGTTGDVVFEFYVDKDPPVVSIIPEGDLYVGKNKYISRRTKITIQADDEKSGVDKIFYGLNQLSVDKEYQEPISIENEGLFALRVKAVDFVGNKSPILSNQFICDAKSPVSNISIGQPKFKSRDTLFISEKTPVTIIATDDHSGVLSSTYKSGDNAETKYSSSFKVDQPGSCVISYFSTDKVNNVEDKKSIEVFVDKQAPVIHYHYSVESIGSKNVRDEKYTIYPSNVMLYIAATDASSGGERIEYKINSGQVLTTNPITGLKTGNYLVEVTAFDVLGNKSSIEIKFSIEK